MSNAEINPVDAFTSSPLNAGAVANPFLRDCPHCHSEQVKASHRYSTQHNGERTI